ncbi:MAG: tetratricopeptide repeat protein [Lewinellaceae bacterium]|nr:tetratricopeptide repeat protein [Lewinellaceae bacterium]
MFACAKDERLIRPTSETIQQSASGKAQGPIRFCYLDADAPLLPQLEEVADGAQGLIVFGLDAFLNVPGQIVAFNFSREGLHALGKPILFWASQHTLALIGNLATDLFSQRRGANVYFDELADIQEPDPFLQSHFSEILRNQEETKQLELALELQKKQLTEAIEAKLSPKRIALDYALPLAKTYAGLDGHSEALKILEEYAPLQGVDWPPALYADVGRIYQGAHRYTEAIELFERAIHYYDKPGENQSTLSIYLSELGDIFKELGSFTQAHDYYERDLKLSEQLAKDNPHSEQLRRDWGIAIAKLADLEKSLGKLESAQQRYEQRLRSTAI